MLAVLAALLATASPAGAANTGIVIGTVRSTGGSALQTAHVTIEGVGSTFTDLFGRYTLTVPFGTHRVEVKAGCMVATETTVVVDGNEPANIVMSPATDDSDHVCHRGGFSIPAEKVVPLTGDDTFLDIALPFAFPFYGQPKTAAKISSNGYLTFVAPDADDQNVTNVPLLGPGAPRDGVFAFWDDLVIDGAASVRTGSSGVAPNRTFAVEWHDVRLFGTELRLTAKVVLAQDGRITMSWSDVDGDSREQGGSATIGIKNGLAGLSTQVLERSTDEPSIFNGDATEFLVDRAPTAKAGPDRTVASGKAFILDGSASSDPDGPPGLRFTWSRLSGPVSPITTPGQAKASVAGIKGPAKATYLLKVNDKLGRGSSDTVTVTIKAST